MNDISDRMRGIVRRAIRHQLIHGRFLHRSFPQRALTGRETPVLMCLWNRPTRIGDVARMLDAQDHPEGVVLYLWNNNRADHGYYIEQLRQFRGTGALASIEIARSPHNLGSIGRFYWARTLELRAPDRPIIIIDDDEDFDTSFVSDAVDAYDPAVAKAWWAWNVGASYWERTEAVPGEPADHIGPGGSVFSSAIVADPRFFTDIPEEFRFLDDIWFSHWVRAGGRRIEKLDVDMSFVMEEKNQYHGQGEIKSRFYDQLNPRD